MVKLVMTIDRKNGKGFKIYFDDIENLRRFEVFINEIISNVEAKVRSEYHEQPI